jgi:hypothetical protein
MTHEEILSKISNLEPSPLDENIPDDDKEAAYCKGYNDAIIDVAGLLKTKSQTKRHTINCKPFDWNETIQKLYGGSDDQE